jgi:hypothetical protein
MPKFERPGPVKTQKAKRLQMWDEFKAGFRRSKKGNLWRNYEGVTLTVFRRPWDGGFGWSISDSEGPEFSPGGFEDEEDALEALWIELEGDEL